MYSIAIATLVAVVSSGGFIYHDRVAYNCSRASLHSQFCVLLAVESTNPDFIKDNTVRHFHRQLHKSRSKVRYSSVPRPNFSTIVNYESPFFVLFRHQKKALGQG